MAACLVGAVAALVGYLIVQTEAWAYLSDDPDACANCHVMNENLRSWVASSHHASATCNDCHAPQAPLRRWLSQAENGLRHGWHFTFHGLDSSPALRSASTRIVEQRCISCHRELLASSLLSAHPVDGGDCTRCHQRVAHG